MRDKLKYSQIDPFQRKARGHYIGNFLGETRKTYTVFYLHVSTLLHVSVVYIVPLMLPVRTYVNVNKERIAITNPHLGFRFVTCSTYRFEIAGRFIQNPAEYNFVYYAGRGFALK